MSNVNPIDTTYQRPFTPAKSGQDLRQSTVETAAPEARTDRVDISDRALTLGSSTGQPEVRADLVARVREAIESGKYVTEDKIDAALDGVARDLAI